VPRYTSVLSHAKNQKLISHTRLLVWDALIEYGPGTANEIQAKLKEHAGQVIKGFWKRLPELRDMGIATELPERACRITGQKCIVWSFLDQVANKIPKTSKLRPSEVIWNLQQRVKNLEKELAAAKTQIQSLTKAGQLPLI
jgi:hypothetical protein